MQTLTINEQCGSDGRHQAYYSDANTCNMLKKSDIKPVAGEEGGGGGSRGSEDTPPPTPK